VVESCRTRGGKIVQRHVLYLGEINDAQRAAWCKTIEVVEAGRGAATQMAIFPQDRQAPELDCAVVRVRLDQLRLERPRQCRIKRFRRFATRYDKLSERFSAFIALAASVIWLA
jgi:transposase